jgi:hypothetical protein
MDEARLKKLGGMALEGASDLAEFFDPVLAKKLDHWLTEQGPTVGQGNATMLYVAVTAVVSEIIESCKNKELDSDTLCRYTALAYSTYIMTCFKAIHDEATKKGLH